MVILAYLEFCLHNLSRLRLPPFIAQYLAQSAYPKIVHRGGAGIGPRDGHEKLDPDSTPVIPVDPLQTLTWFQRDIVALGVLFEQEAEGLVNFEVNEEPSEPGGEVW